MIVKLETLEDCGGNEYFFNFHGKGKEYVVEDYIDGIYDDFNEVAILVLEKALKTLLAERIK